MFFERLLFQYFVYDADYSALSPKRMPTAFVYTMNVPYQVMLESHYTESFQSMESFIQRVFSKPETLYVNDTYQSATTVNTRPIVSRKPTGPAIGNSSSPSTAKSL